ncbi:MAG: hypothetical protein LAP38_03280 [Acidobacteriia bacterium]|nr:hypothetical protein [Terriglobia bacterium]
MAKKSTKSSKRKPATDKAATIEKHLAKYHYLVARLNSALGVIAGTAERYPGIAALLIVPVVEAAEQGVNDIRKVLAGLISVEDFVAVRRASREGFKKRPEPLKAARRKGSKKQ